MTASWLHIINQPTLQRSQRSTIVLACLKGCDVYTLWDGLGAQTVRECVGHYVPEAPLFRARRIVQQPLDQIPFPYVCKMYWNLLLFLFCLIIVSVQEFVIFMHPELQLLPL